MIHVSVVSDYCMYVHRYGETETTEWKKKTDYIHGIVELPKDHVVSDWQQVYNSLEGTYYYEEGEE